MLLWMSTGETIASLISARNCFWASNPVPVLRIFDRVWACASRIAQTYVRIESLRRSTLACVKPSDLSRTNVVQLFKQAPGRMVDVEAVQAGKKGALGWSDVCSMSYFV